MISPRFPTASIRDNLPVYDWRGTYFGQVKVSLENYLASATENPSVLAANEQLGLRWGKSRVFAHSSRFCSRDLPSLT
jgi:hypothetical protein